MNSYGYLDFLKICYVSNPENFFGFVIKSDGVWMIPPDHERYRGLTPDELTPLFKDFSTHNFSTPVLPFPCTHQQLSKFLNKTGLDGMLDPASDLLVTGKTTEQGASSQTGGEEVPASDKGGRKKTTKPKSPFAEAIEEAFVYFLKSGNTELLKAGQRNAFAESLRRLIKTENSGDSKNKQEKELQKYLCERIKSVKIREENNINKKIETLERQVSAGKNSIKVIKPKGYSLGDLSKGGCKIVCVNGHSGVLARPPL